MNYKLTTIKKEIKLGKEALISFSKLIDEKIAKQEVVSNLIDVSYLIALSNLAKTYSNFNIIKDFNQLDNFFYLVRTISKIYEGLIKESTCNKEFYKMQRDTIIKDAKLINTSDEYLQEHILRMFKLNKEHELNLANCKEDIYPKALLNLKSTVPFKDEDGLMYETLSSYISDVRKSNSAKKKTRKSSITK